MKILLDVGANVGQTARAALASRYEFDKIYCFEPAPTCWPELEAIADRRIELCKYGLWKEACTRELYEPGSESASIFSDMYLVGEQPESVPVELKRASEWVAMNIQSDDLVFAKLNCEGAECDIVEDLVDTGELRKIYNLMIAFDVRRSPTLARQERPLRRRLRAEGYRNVAFSEDVMRGATHEKRIRHWLDQVGAHERLPRSELEMKYVSTLDDLASRRGILLRIEAKLRRQVFPRLSPHLQDVSRVIWRRIMRGRRQGV